MTIPKRTIGSQGLEASALGLGCMALTSFYGHDTEAAHPTRVIHAAIDRGIGILDTSDAYGPYVNEEAVGDAIHDRRERVVLSTKFGLVRTQETGNGLQSNPICGRPEYVKRSCEESLGRLRTDYIDLYIQHRFDPETPIEETVGAMGELVAAGKVRFIALCEVGPTTIARAHRTFPLSAVHAEYSLWSRDPEDEVLPKVEELGLGFLPYSPLGRGFLTGLIRKIGDLDPDDWRRQSPRFQGENFQRNLDLVDKLVELARAKGVTPAQLALAWILSRGEFVVPFQGATSVGEIEENVGAVDVALSEHEMRAIDEIAPVGVASGEAWPPGSPGAMRDTE